MLSAIALKYFHEVADAGSIAVAASRLNVAASAVSRQIRILEEEVTTELFDRQPRGMKLTPAGEQLAYYVRRSILDQEQTIEAIKSRRTDLFGTIRIAAAEGLATSFIPYISRQFQRIHPDVSVRSVTRSHEEIFRDIRQGNSDLGLSFESTPHRDISVLYHVNFDTHVIMRHGHALSKRESLDLETVSRHPIATSPGTTTRQLIEQRAAVKGLYLDVKYESNNSTGIFAYLKDSDAVAFSISVTAKDWIQRGELVIVPLLEKNYFQRSIEITSMSGRSLSPLLSNFVTYIFEELLLLRRQSK
jgi:DNA-binding transcriptional LysR family regulator